MLFEPYVPVRFHMFIQVRVTEWPPIVKKLLTRLTICFLSIRTNLVFPTSVFGVGISF